MQLSWSENQWIALHSNWAGRFHSIWVGYFVSKFLVMVLFSHAVEYSWLMKNIDGLELIQWSPSNSNCSSIVEQIIVINCMNDSSWLPIDWIWLDDSNVSWNVPQLHRVGLKNKSGLKSMKYQWLLNCYPLLEISL